MEKLILSADVWSKFRISNLFHKVFKEHVKSHSVRLIFLLVFFRKSSNISTHNDYKKVPSRKNKLYEEFSSNMVRKNFQLLKLKLNLWKLTINFYKKNQKSPPDIIRQEKMCFLFSKQEQILVWTCTWSD